MGFGGVKQCDKVFAADVEDFIPIFQHRIKVGILDMADPCRRRGHRSCAVGIGMARHSVPGPAEKQEGRDVYGQRFNQKRKLRCGAIGRCQGGQGEARAAIIGGKLYMITFEAPRLSYFGRAISDFKALADSAKLPSASK